MPERSRAFISPLRPSHHATRKAVAAMLDLSTTGGVRPWILRSPSMHPVASSHLRLSAALLFAVQLTDPSWAQIGASQATKPSYPDAFEITNQWDYSCRNTVCSFECSGRLSANQVTRLTIYLGTIPFDNRGNSPAIFYEFATRYIPNSSGFIISTGLSTFSCQVNGMTMDYSGPARSRKSNEIAKD